MPEQLPEPPPPPSPCANPALGHTFTYIVFWHAQPGLALKPNNLLLGPGRFCPSAAQAAPLPAAMNGIRSWLAKAREVGGIKTGYDWVRVILDGNLL